ncbi:MAG: hypothetical protein ACYTEZ_17445 [Planctomycetota bacterium]|jgi:hypothetical protein
MAAQIGKEIAKRRPGGAGSSLIGLAACAAVVVGYFLPWTSLTPTIEGAVGLKQQQVARHASPGEQEKRGARAARRLSDGAAVSGADWAAVLDLAAEDESLTDRQRKVLDAAHLGVVALPYAAGALAVLLLLLSVPARTVLRSGAGPAAALFAIARLRWVNVLLLVLVMALGIAVGIVAGVLWAGAARAAETGDQLGRGVQLMAGGAGVAFLSAFLGYGRGRLRALLFAVILLVALVGLAAYGTRG